MVDQLNKNQTKPIVQAEGLTKQVANVSDDDTLVLLRDINFVVYPGESIALIGPSGSGKSTLLGLLAGLDDATAGRILIDGKNIFDLDEDARAKLRGEMIGFVFQSFQLLSSLTALENVMMPLEIMGVDNARDLATQILGRVGLEHRLQHYPKQLSGGEQQRVAIARAFAPRPKILLADEPTGNLDRATGKRIIDLLYELNKEHGTTLVLVTHDESLAEKCDRQLELIDGQLGVDSRV
jgi:putative ABC transport system ATP-binding protein